jgi:hypothetical protein
MLVRKTTSTFFYALKNYLRKWIFNILFELYFKPYASYLAKGIFTKSFIEKKDALLKICLEIKYYAKNYFYELFFHVSKELFENPNFYSALCKLNLFVKIIKFS